MFFVDYGTVSEVRNVDLFYLHKKFAKRSMQAIRCCLDKIQPKDGLWTIDALKCMQDFVGHNLYGTVTAVNNEVCVNLNEFVFYLYNFIKYSLYLHIFQERTVYFSFEKYGKQSTIEKMLIYGNHAMPTTKLV